MATENYNLMCLKGNFQNIKKTLDFIYNIKKNNDSFNNYNISFEEKEIMFNKKEVNHESISLNPILIHILKPKMI